MFLKEETSVNITINKSKFIAYLFPCDLESFKLRYQQIKNEHSNATHHCYSYLFKEAIKYYDDKEPAGSAGLPIYNALKANGLEKVACIVVRYFGGIKLGKSGLYRAYQDATLKAINASKKYEKIKMLRYQYIVDYKTANKLKPLLLKIDPETKCLYSEQVTFIFLARITPDFKEIDTVTKGRKPQELEPIWLEREKKL